MKLNSIILNPEEEIPDLNQLHGYARKVIESLPQKYNLLKEDIIIKIENFPSVHTLNTINLKDKYELLGLYIGTPTFVKDKKKTNFPNCISLFRCPIIRYSLDNEESIKRVVYQVMMEEIAHHFGWKKWEKKFPL